MMTDYPVLDVTVPIQVTRGLNAREHHMVRAKRVKEEREAVDKVLCSQAAKVYHELAPNDLEQLGARVTLLRPYARTPLDSDNLSGAFKGVRDEVASFLGVDDKSDRIHWRYVQCKAAKKKEAGYSYGHREAHLHIRLRIEILPASDVDPLLTAVRVLREVVQNIADDMQCAGGYSDTEMQAALATADALATFEPKEMYNVR